jgi:hypothetical protein
LRLPYIEAEDLRRNTVQTIFNAKIIQKTMEFEKVDKTAKLVTEYLRRYTVQTIFNAKIIGHLIPK